MKKIIIGLVVLMSLSFSGCNSPVNNKISSQSVTESITDTDTSYEEIIEPDKSTDTVYVTRTGAKYHTSGCRYLKQSSFEIDIETAKYKGYEPCSICNPEE